ncbi:MAG: hypothetical protein K0R34_2837 [Herbinix sp.]|jgi:hypothetical protein|nr:hypothetical protein [Herbinix sp.]
MKAVVVEIKNNKAAVLSDNGCVVTVKNNGYKIGQVIHMIDKNVKLTKKVAVFAASAAAFVLLGTGAWAYATPYSYVSVDVNPSIEYTVNRFDRVLTVKAVNDDGKEILQEINLNDLENQTIEAALLSTIEQITVAGYFTGTTEGGIVITTASEDGDKADELATDLQQVVEEELTETEETVTVEAYSVGLERVEEARLLGVTPGKLNLVEKLQASSSDPEAINTEEWLNKSVKDIMKATKDNRKASVVSGSAITIDQKELDKEAKETAKEEKRKEREEQKEEKKSIKKSDDQNKVDVSESDTSSDKEEKKEANKKKDKAEKQSSKDSKKSDTSKGQSPEDEDASSLEDKAKNNSTDKAENSKKSSNSNGKNEDSISDEDEEANTNQTDDANADGVAKENNGNNNTNSGGDNKGNEGSGKSGGRK